MNRKIMIIFFSMLFLTTFLSASAIAFNENEPPNPPIIEGPLSGKIRESYDYYITLTDPDYGDFMWTLEVDFGDEIVVYGGAGCGQTWQNGTIIVVSHKWNIADDYEIKARSMDSFDEWSDWSESIIVSMPKSKPIYQWFYWYLENHPHLFLLFRQVLG